MADEVIERDAVAMLSEFAQARGLVIEPLIPIEDIVEKHLKLGIEFDDTHRLFGVPRSGLDRGQGPDILGAIFFDDQRIVIDESLDAEENPSMEGRFRFSLGHEGGGHWRLHRHLFAKDEAQGAMFDDLEEPSFVCRSSQAKERVEWQADFYASCLLMPRKLVFDAWRKEFNTYKPVIFDPTKHASAADRPRRNGPRSLGEILNEMSNPITPTFSIRSPKSLLRYFVSRRSRCGSGWRSWGCCIGKSPSGGGSPSWRDANYFWKELYGVN